MDNNKKKQFANIFNKAAILYDKDISNTFLNAYYEFLKDYDIEQISLAMKIHCRNIRFWPKVSEIIQIIENKTDDKIQIEATAEQQWRIVLQTLGRGPFDDPITKILCKRQYNHTYLKDILVKDENWEQRRFCRSYQLLANKMKDDMPMIGDMPKKIQKLSQNLLKSF